MVGGFFWSLVDQNVDQSVLQASTSVNRSIIGHGVGQFVLHVRYDVGVQIHGDAKTHTLEFIGL